MLDGGALLGLVIFGVWVFAIIDVITSDATRIRNLPKLVWLLVVVLLSVVGAVAWFAFGRPQGETWTASEPRFRPPVRRRTVDDTSDVLARIEERDKKLREWA